MMNNLPYYVTPEWAKQLAHDTFGRLHNIDYASMKVVCVQQKMYQYGVPIAIERTREPAWFSCNTPYEPIMEPTILVYMEQIADTINDEITYLGYDPMTNTLLLGGTHNYWDTL